VGVTNLLGRTAAAIRWRHAAAGALAAAAVGEVAARLPGGAHSPSLALILALLGTLPLAAAPAHSRTAAAAVIIGVVLAIVEPGRPTVAAAAAAVGAVYLAARRGPARYAVLIALPLLAAVALPVGKTARLWAAVIFALAAAAVALGTLRRAQRRAAHADASVRALQATLAGHQARGERARIARELHDVAAHHISLIALQSDAVALTSPELSPKAAKLVADIGDAARTALAEMRRIVGVLRADAGPEVTARAPQPGLRQLVVLVEEARAAQRAGVRLVVRGPVRDLDPGIELTAYRIVQEALTNARRHAPAAAVDIELDYAATHLRIRVRDIGPGPPLGGSGYGLTGMRERASMLGGCTRTGPTTTGGHLVDAYLPLPAVSS
jgi:signal transduction histidine kinase